MSHARLLGTVLVLTSLGTLAACSGPHTPTPPPLHGTSTRFGYDPEDGPDRWADLSDEYATCRTGVAQSPIDLPTADDASGSISDGLSLDYPDTIDRDDVVNNGHSLQLTTSADASIQLDGHEWNLTQMHFHAPSEHTLGDVPAEAEFHFVHQDASGATVVLAVLAREGEMNMAWQPFVDTTTTPADETVSTDIDLRRLIPTALYHLRYQGSFTTPPCTEGVTWLVLDEPVALGAAQLAALRSAYDHNARPVQPLGDREVQHVEG